MNEAAARARSVGGTARFSAGRRVVTCFCTARALCARNPVPDRSVPDVGVGDAASRRVAGILVRRRHLSRRYLLALHQRACLRTGPDLGGVPADARGWSRSWVCITPRWASASTRWLPARGILKWLIGVPALWLLMEWLRGWVLSGFPWLALGYSQIDSWLAGYAPVGGVYFISLLVLVSAGALVLLLRGSEFRADSRRRRGAHDLGRWHRPVASRLGPSSARAGDGEPGTRGNFARSQMAGGESRSDG